MPNVVGDDYAQTVAAMKKAVLYFTTTARRGHDEVDQGRLGESGRGHVVPYKSTVMLARSVSDGLRTLRGGRPHQALLRRRDVLDR